MKLFKVMRRSPLSHWECLFSAKTRYQCQKYISKLSINRKVSAPCEITTRELADFRQRNL